MLLSKKNIFETNPPFLMEMANGNWLLIANITQEDDSIQLKVIEEKTKALVTRDIIINQEPFYVGADIWELEYGSKLMTLSHTTLSKHPANDLWEKWLSESST